MVLNAGWLLVTQQGWLWASVVVIVALLAVLTALMVVVQRTPTSGWAERILVDGTFGLYLGWIAVATCANVTATLVDSGVDPARPWDAIAAVAVLAVVAVVGLLLARRLGGRIAVAAAATWGLLWLAIGRTTDQPRSLPTAAAAVLAALVIVVATARSRRQARSAG
jgi:hypothetical protein